MRIARCGGIPEVGVAMGWDGKCGIGLGWVIPGCFGSR